MFYSNQTNYELTDSIKFDNKYGVCIRGKRQIIFDTSGNFLYNMAINVFLKKKKKCCYFEKNSIADRLREIRFK